MLDIVNPAIGSWLDLRGEATVAIFLKYNFCVLNIYLYIHRYMQLSHLLNAASFWRLLQKFLTV